MDKYEKLLAPVAFSLNPITPVHWADLGCGTGVFTKVLADFLPPNSRITAIDSNRQHLPTVMGNGVGVTFQKNNFETGELLLPPLDGILMANAFHFVQSKEALILRLEKYFHSNPVFLMVEYEHSRPNAWEPFPIPFQQMKALFRKLNYKIIEKIGQQESVYGGMMYACLISKN